MCRSVDVLTSDAAYHSVRTGVSPPPWSARPSPSVLAAPLFPIASGAALAFSP
jgi:hypothetical protein